MAKVTASIKGLESIPKSFADVTKKLGAGAFTKGAASLVSGIGTFFLLSQGLDVLADFLDTTPERALAIAKKQQESEAAARDKLLSFQLGERRKGEAEDDQAALSGLIDQQLQGALATTPVASTNAQDVPNILSDLQASRAGLPSEIPSTALEVSRDVAEGLTPNALSVLGVRV